MVVFRENYIVNQLILDEPIIMDKSVVYFGNGSSDPKTLMMKVLPRLPLLPKLPGIDVR